MNARMGERATECAKGGKLREIGGGRWRAGSSTHTAANTLLHCAQLGR